MTDENLKPAPDAGAPTKKMDEATATLLVALFCMAQRPYVSPQRQVFDFNAGLRHPGVTRNVVDGTETTQASIVQQIVATAQTAGWTEQAGIKLWEIMPPSSAERHDILPEDGILCAQRSFSSLRAGDRTFAPWKRALDAVKANWSALSSLLLLRWGLSEGKPSFKDLFRVGAGYGRLWALWYGGPCRRKEKAQIAPSA